MEKLNITGYPHIDKPWMQFYDRRASKLYLPKINMVDYLKQKSEKWGSNVAQTYYGNQFTYEELFHKADIASKVLSQLGVKKGDRILTLNPNIPETAELWFGATQIGAVTDFIDPRPDSMDFVANGKKVLEIIKAENIKHIIALDKCYLAMLKPIEHELKEYGIDKIVLTSANDSMTLEGKIDYLKDVVEYNMIRNSKNISENIRKLKDYEALLLKIKAMGEEDLLLEQFIATSPLKILKYSNLAKECRYTTFEKAGSFEDPNYIGHTSGTSGSRPKPIVLTNKNAISTLEQVYAAKVASEAGDNSLHILPFFAPFGAYDNYLLNIVAGVNNIDIPEFEINEFGYLIKKYHPNVIMGTPAWLAALPDYDYLINEDLSCIKKIIYGGDSMSAKDEEKLNQWLKKHNSKAIVEKGYGMSEYCGCGSFARAEYNVEDTIGIPLPDTTFAIVDPDIEDRLVPLRFSDNQDRLFGELAVSSDAVTSGILDNQVIVPHYDLYGKSYIRTRDLVEMDRNGIFYHQARKDRSFSRFDGFKVKPFEIEKSIKENEYVQNAILVEYFDDRQRGLMPICHVVLNKAATEEEQIEIVKDIVYNQIIANPTMSTRQIPSKFKIRSSLPITKNSKVDFNYLKNEQLDGTEINVDVTETNMAVDNIQIYKNKDVKVRKKK